MYRSVARGLCGLVRRAGKGFATEAGSGVPGEIGITSGAPLDLFDRKALIYSPARTAAQQGLSQTIYGSGPAWKIEFENVEKWENQLTGWTSTADSLENVSRSSLAFYSKEEAVMFCTKHGWDYEVVEVNERKRDRQKRFASYGDNFSTRRAGPPDLSTFRSNRSPELEAELGAGTPAKTAKPAKSTTSSKAKAKVKTAAKKAGKA